MLLQIIFLKCSLSVNNLKFKLKIPKVVGSTFVDSQHVSLILLLHVLPSHCPQIRAKSLNSSYYTTNYFSVASELAKPYFL